MANRTQGTLLANSIKEFEDAIQLTARAGIWQKDLQYHKVARFKKEHYRQIVELAFMRSFLTWEGFLEEAFILYLMGKKSPSGYSPLCYATPFSRQHAEDLLAADMLHTDWSAADRVINRAQRFFKGGKPFYDAIRPQINLLNNLKTIRNALSHNSVESAEKFETFVRAELTFLPPGMSPGIFLTTLKPNLTPPKSYIQFYAENFHTMAKKIIPT